MTSSPGQLTWGACHIEGLYPYAVSFYACKVLRYVLGKSWLICPAGTNIVSGTETVCFSRAIRTDQGRSSEERYIFKAHPDRRTQIRAKAERYHLHFLKSDNGFDIIILKSFPLRHIICLKSHCKEGRRCCFGKSNLLLKTICKAIQRRSF